MRSMSTPQFFVKFLNLAVCKCDSASAAALDFVSMYLA